jgi:hypothetical protein
MRVLVCAMTTSPHQGIIGHEQMQTIDQALRFVLDRSNRQDLWIDA